MEFYAKLLDSMTKALPVAALPVSREYRCGSALRGEVFAFQLAYRSGSEKLDGIRIETEGELAAALRIRQVGLIPTELPATCFDENVLSTEPGLFPDPLTDVPPEGVTAYAGQCRSLHFQLAVPPEQAAGKYEFKLRLTHPERGILCEKEFTLEVVGATLPPQRVERTEWFYCDCLASIYKCELWSGEFWEILERYFRNMTGHGITQILTPLVTPPLDTAVGTERPTVQLLDIETDGNGRWSFGFERLKRWVELARRCGFRRFEFAHLFSQWGAECAPKVMAKTPEGVRRVFGWETDAASKEYTAFLEAMLGALRGFIRENGLEKSCCMHVSDEPQPKDFDRYREHLALVRRATGDEIPVCDALSHPGLLEPDENGYPVTIIQRIPAFRAAGVSPLWAYYCCGPETGTTNRFLHYPGARIRGLGIQLFHYGIAGFLHWGYNFWYSRLSRRVIDPWRSPDAGGEFPGGDPFLVYPGTGGVPVDSLRNELMREAFQDIRALELLASLAGGRERADEILLELCGGTLSVTDFPVTSEAFSQLRHAVNMRIKALKHNG